MATLVGEKESMKKLFIQSLLVLFVLTNTTFAEKNWKITNFKKFVSLQFDGEVTHGDKLSFNFLKKNCNKVNYYFSAYSAEKNKDFLNLQGHQVPLVINGVKTWGRAVYTSPFLMGHRAMFYLGSDDANNLSHFFSRVTNYQIKIVNRGGFIAKAYFDIDHNKWNLADSTQAFNKAINTCKDYSERRIS